MRKKRVVLIVNYATAGKKASSSTSTANSTKELFQNENEITNIAEAAALETQKRQEQNLEPLIIPLPGGDEKKEGEDEEDSKKKEPLLVAAQKRKLQKQQQQQQSENKEDEKAIEALIQDASNNSSSATTNSSKLIIPATSTSITLNKQKKEDDAQKYKSDYSTCANDLDVTSKAYIHVPISEFGAAMSRGMNPTIDFSQTNNKEVEMKPRHYRLGLGAAPLVEANEKSKLPKKKESSTATTGGAKRHFAQTKKDINRKLQPTTKEELTQQQQQEKQKLLDVHSEMQGRSEWNT
mmetsp:Transcript_18412/g.26454  ORF Transcript_18412/g.26454 Transcript_18412/m.26454 type:complete len:294 (-) Transcript_18412:720-1601(-)